MAVHKELITSGKFDEKFKRALLNYYSYGFMNLGSFDKSKHQTILEDWLRLNRVLSDYLERSDDHNTVMFASTDSQSMEENPFHRIYRFCKYKPFLYPAYFLHTIAALSNAFELRGGVDSLDLDEEKRMHLMDTIESHSKLKTSDLLLFYTGKIAAQEGADKNKTPNNRLNDLAEIGLIESEQNYTVNLLLDGFTAISEKLKDKSEADGLKSKCEKQTAIVISVEKKDKLEVAPALYNLTTLQMDAVSILGYTEKQTRGYMQALFQKRLCAYPRTNSSFRADGVLSSVPKIVALSSKLCGLTVLDQIRAEQNYNSKKVFDHHAIVPTVNVESVELGKLSAGEREILKLVARRVVIAAGEPFRYTETDTKVKCGDAIFTAKGRQITDIGWKQYGEYEDSDLTELPEISEGMSLNVVGTEIRKGDHRWSLPELTMKRVLDVGTKVSANFERHVRSALDFLSKYYLFGEVGTFILDRISTDNFSPFRFKHEYYMQSLNDFNILDLLCAIEDKKWCKIKYNHGTANFGADLLCYPLEIRISNMQGREFLMYYEPFHRSFTALRIEFIDSIEYYDDEKIKRILSSIDANISIASIRSDIENAKEALKCVWGVSTSKRQDRNAIKPTAPDLVSLRIAYNPDTDYYIVNRLERERRFGTVVGSDDHSILSFSIKVSDTTELRPWVRSFYSRILSCDGMDTESFSLDSDVESIVETLLNNELTPPPVNATTSSAERWDTSEQVKKKLGNGIKAREHDLLFNEAFGVYYYVMADVFTRLSSENADAVYTENEIDRIIEDAFSKYHLRTGGETEELLPSEIKELLTFYGFLKKTKKNIKGKYTFVKRATGNGFDKVAETETAYSSRYECSPDIEIYRDVIPLSKMELRWLKTVISDRESKIQLFMSQEEISVLENLIKQYEPGMEPLPMDKVVFYDRFHFSNEESKWEARALSTLLNGIFDQRVVRIKYRTMKNQIKLGEFKPIIIEFSKRNNRFQCFLQECASNRIYTMNVSRIEEITETGTIFDYSNALQEYETYKRSNKTSVEIEFYDVRNITDRILTELSPWEKRCSYDKKTNLYKLKVFYQKQDESDLVIRLLGYGAYLRVTDRDHPICRDIQSRMNRQLDLIRERRSVRELGENR